MSLLILAFLAIIGLVPVVELPPCPPDEVNASVCGWDASEYGNGQGRSYVGVYGVRVYLS